jgi:hypothetical protein
MGKRLTIADVYAELQALKAERMREQAERESVKVESKPTNRTRKPTRRKSRQTTPVASSCITAGDAWKMLGADPQFEPRDAEKPATAYQLWRLNALGALTVRR